MVTFDTKSLLERAKRNYEKAWVESAALLDKDGKKFKLDPTKGTSHPVYQFMQEARDVLIKLGFEELVLPIFVDEDEIYKEYGSEAALILDRLFYTAELPRPDIGISAKKIELIKEIIPGFENIDGLQALLRAYKKGEIEADNFLEAMCDKLGISPPSAASVVDQVFPEFKQLKPVPSKRTLRSHTTALWFPVLGSFIGRKPLPIQFFHTGLKFRREQKLDATHLYESNTLSLVVCAEEITLEDCMAIARTICINIGFKDAKFEIKKVTGKYYAPGMEFEVFVKHESQDAWLEIGDGGFYSPVSCAKYNIPHPVFNIGFGVERIAMIRTGAQDIRQLVYPYFYSPTTLSDAEIVKLVKILNQPTTAEGRNLVEAIVNAALDKGDQNAPLEASVGSFTIQGKHVEVHIWEKEEGAKLVGKAAFNEVHVKDGSISCHDGRKKEVPEGATNTGITFIKAVASDFAAQLERYLEGEHTEDLNVKVKMVKKSSDVNLHIDAAAMRFITDHQKRVDVKGPAFIGLRASIKK